MDADSTFNTSRRKRRRGSHRRLLVDVLIFQVKLAMDGLRDLLLSPLSLLAALLGAVTDFERPGRYFYSILRIGRRSDRWIGLFTAEEAPAGVFYQQSSSPDDPPPREPLYALERLIIEEYEQGNLLAATRDRMEVLIERARKNNKNQ